MCRFLMIRSRVPASSVPWLESFADMAEASRAPDGDRQADGWGASWQDAEGNWKGIKSIAPVWRERQSFTDVPPSRVLIVHARSASFPGQKGNIDYSQPFVDGSYAFVFNGLLKGVSLPSRNAGFIGSQKIWDLLLGFLDNHPPLDALERLTGILERRTREVAALNLGLCDGERIFAYCRFTGYPEYYQLQAAETPDFTAVCSEPLPGRGFRPVPTGEVLSF
ncbi:MAG: class II glutamine amidotransferase [Candidatus Aminicenantales bacterium]